ncbi:MAG: enolase C-terminal domain-like protein [Acidimicrobiales bacterium]
MGGVAGREELYGACVSELSASAYEIPTEQPEADGTIEWTSTVLVVVQARAADKTGLGWTYATPAAAAFVGEKLASVAVGQSAMDVGKVTWAMTRACRNVGQPGIAACAVSAVDVALWDLKARLLDLSLGKLLGQVRNCVPVYGSGGFTTFDDATTRAQLEDWTQGLGLRKVKIKIGESFGSNERRDLHRVALARQVIGQEVELFVDANGAYGAKQAARLGRLMGDSWGVSWFEEPVSSDDIPGLKDVRDACPQDVAAGEYGFSPWYYTEMLRAGAVDCLQADATRCLGFTGWLAVANLAQANHLDISGHCAPNLHTPVAACVPNLRHLEYFSDHVRIERLLFEGSLSPVDGSLVPDTSSAGLGLAFRSKDAAPYRVL